ncbi:hypothetical protein DC083_05200 [Ignatzschineria ureiclastica]|uniref:Uncharacterized protein n=1 Tax=Ignatzschineria ureiclastica TaxID=472582 RepID=A0A2U2AF90_9GAMM|nr:hypothetical protein DC083_05200 [Ignatzschineria ureiclastica]GGZ97776.1 hypothetical protein GCM10007162_12470 [Ignatzschineria ureiclastica]
MSHCTKPQLLGAEVFIIVRLIQNKHYSNAGASAVRNKKAVLSGILQVLFSMVLCFFKNPTIAVEKPFFLNQIDYSYKDTK